MTNKMPVVASKDFMEGYNAGWNDFGFKKDYRFKESTDNEPKGNKTPNPVDLQKGKVNEVEKALEAEKKVTQKHYDLEAVTRLEIIDSNGRSYVNLHANPMEFSYQDHGKTLKIFCGNKEDMSKPEPKIDMKKERVDPVNIRKETYRCAHDYVLKNQGYNNSDHLIREYECSICGENKMTIQS